MPTSQQMTCMEVWGGNQATESGVVMAGLDAWVYSQPYQEAASGGDVYYVSSCATGRITRLLVADVSGHGEQVAKIAGGLRQLMRRYVNHISQRRFVAQMNRQFGELADGDKDGGKFATAAVATFFSPTNYLSFSNAGHPSPLLYRAKQKQWFVLEEAARQQSGALEESAENMPLGMDEQGQYEELHLPLRVGDLVLFYTDSLIESVGRDGEFLGISGLKNILVRLDAARPDELVSGLLEAIRAEHAGNLTDDDVTALLVRPNGLGPTVPFSRKLLAPWQVLGGIISSLLFRRGKDMPLPELSVPNIGGAMIDALGQRWGGKTAASEEDDAEPARKE